MTVDFPDWGHPQAHANAISTTGAPLLVFKQVIDSGSAVNLPASGTITRPSSGQFSLNQPGYEMVISVGAVSGASLPLSVELRWFDSLTGLLVDDEVYYFFGGDINGHKVHGRGPSKGDRLVIVIRNYSATNAQSITYTMLQTSRIYTREFWKTITQGGVNPAYPGFNATPANMPANVLCTQSVSVSASGSSIFLLPFYTGTVRLLGTGGGAAGAQIWELIDVAEQVAGAQVFAAGSSGQSGFAPNGINSLWLPDIALPRVQCSLTLINNATVAQIMSTNIMAQEDRS